MNIPNTPENLSLISDIRSGKHKQFVYNEKDQSVKCKCGHAAVWWKTGFICGTITAYACKFN